MPKPAILGMDLEGVLIPEVWIAFSEKTGIEKLRLTTRDVESYDELMSMRLSILKENKLKLSDIQDVIATLDPLPGALDFVNWAKENTQLVILSDTYYEFAKPLMKKLGYPTLFCHSLETDSDGFITDYKLRDPDSKRKAVLSFKEQNFYTVCTGDSFNDTTMLKEADKGILFHAPSSIAERFPQFDSLQEYDELKAAVLDAITHQK